MKASTVASSALHTEITRLLPSAFKKPLPVSTSA